MSHVKAKQINLTAKGDLIVGGDNGSSDILPIGENNQALMVENGNIVWKNPSAPYTLSSLADISFGELSDGQILSYNGTVGKWINLSHNYTLNDGVRVTDSKFDLKGDGPAIEVGYVKENDWSVIQSYDRTNSVFKSLYLRASNVFFQINGSDTLVVNENGNVGIGTPYTDARLSVNPSISLRGQGDVDNTSDNPQFVRGNGGVLNIAAGPTGAYSSISLQTAGFERVKVDRDGRVGINTGNMSLSCSLTVVSDTYGSQLRVHRNVGHNSTSVACGYINLSGFNANSSLVDYGAIYSIVSGNSVGSENGTFVAAAMNNGTMTPVLSATSLKVTFPGYVEAAGIMRTSGIGDMNSIPVPDYRTLVPFHTNYQSSNRPGLNYSGGIDAPGGLSNYRWQLCTAIPSTTLRLYVRQMSAGTWQGWHKIVTENENGHMIVGPSSVTPLAHRICSDVVEGSSILTIGKTNTDMCGFFQADDVSWNTSASAMRLARNSTTSRSLNASGTLNASGADYAEYLYKSTTCGEILKGDVVGINSEGKLTDIFDEAHSFVVKSTDPAIVGNDTWSQSIGSEPVRPNKPEEPLKPTLDDEQAKDENEVARYEQEMVQYEYDMISYQNAMTQYEQDLISYESIMFEYKSNLELERQKVDRVAFSGQVPVNFTGANVGDYLIPVRNGDGSIGLISKTENDITFAEYKKSIGKVWKILPDGRAWISVKIG